jgi:Flp pilus assembly protein TadG
MADLTDIKRQAADAVKRGDADGLARLVAYVADCTRLLVNQANWAKNRVAKMKLQHENEYSRELSRASAFQAEADELSTFLKEVTGMVVVVKPEPAPPTEKKRGKKR